MEEIRPIDIIQLDKNNRCISANCVYMPEDKTISYTFETDEERTNFFSNINDYVYSDGAFILDEQPSIEDEKTEQEATLQNMMYQVQRVAFLIDLPDSEAAKIPYCYEPWKNYINQPLSRLNEQGKENRIEYDGKIWKVRNDIPVVLENQPPSIETASLYERIDVEHEGTIEDPIPYDQTMTVYKDKYYLEDGIKYLCIRDSGQPLYATCASLVGNYFELV